MSEHISNVETGTISNTRAAKIDRVVKPLGGTVVSAQGRTWIASRNTGHPFNDARSKAFTEALQGAGFYPMVPAKRAR